MLWLAGAVTVAWVGWGYLDARLYQHRQEKLLEEALASPSLDAGAAGERDARVEGEPTGIPADELANASSTRGLPALASQSTSMPVDRGPSRTAALRSASRDTSSRPALEALGRIVVPRLDLDVIVADGIDARTLRRAAGHIPGTSRLGSGGNVGIAGHRDSWFRPLKDVRAGDEVVVTTPGAISRYRVEWAEIVLPDDTSALRPTAYPALTLVTCYPFHYLGNAPDRFIVRARLIESRAATAADVIR